MSLRPVIFAVKSIEPLRRVVGSKDEAWVARLEEDFRQRLRDADEDTLRLVRSVAQDVVAGKVPGGVEREDHVHAVCALARIAGAVTGGSAVTDGDWKHYGWEAYYDSVAEDLPDAAREALEFLVDGRPLVGEVIESGWSYYAWLTHAEVVSFHDALHVLEHRRAEVARPNFCDGFHQALRDWLQAVEDGGGDLWLVAN